jgi:hypothetical protein
VAQGASTIDQVRELLYGEAMRTHGRRLENANEMMSALEQRMLKRFSEVETSIEALARLLRMEQSASVRAIGGAIVEMGRQITSLSEIHDRYPDKHS